MLYPNSFLGRIFKYYLLMPSHPGKLRVQDFLGKYCFPKGIKIRDKKGLRFNLAANDWMTRIILLHKGYETESLQLANTILKDGGIFLDIGANFGLYSCILTYENPGVTAIAVEPNYMVLNRLIDNVKLNKLVGRVKIINTAVARSEQLLSLQISNFYNLGTASYDAENIGYLNVAGYTLEHVLESNKLTSIDLVKIDIEGKEMDILENFPFEKYLVKNMILEFNCLSKVDFHSFQSFFQQRGFSLYNVRGKELTDTSDIIEDNIWLKYTGRNDD